MVITLENVRQLLSDREAAVIQITPLYEPKAGRKYSLLRELFKPERMYWLVVEDIPVRLTNGMEVVIPKGFKTDLSSSPQQTWAVAPPFGDFLFAAIIHDYLYVHNLVSREFADCEMLIWSMIICDDYDDNIRRFKAVRKYGKSWWDS